MNISKIKVKTLYWLIYGIIFLLLSSGFLKLPPLVSGLMICLVSFIVPGAVVVETAFFSRTLDSFETVFWSLFISTVTLIIGIAFHVILGIAIGKVTYSIYILILINLIFIVFYFNDKKIWKRQISLNIRGIIYFILPGLFLLYFATNVIPPLQDNTLTTQSTAYGLSKHFVPKTFTDRYLNYEFAHPPLMHFYTAASLFLAGHLEDVKYYYDYAQKFEELMNKRPKQGEKISFSVFGFNPFEVEILKIEGDEIILDKDIPFLEPNRRLVPVGKYRFIRDNQIKEDYIPVSERTVVRKVNYGIIKSGEYWKMAREVYETFYAQPLLLYSRLPNIFFTLLSCWVVYLIVLSFTQSKILSCFALLVFITIPELLIRAVGGSYTAVDIYFILIVTYIYLAGKRKWVLFCASAMAALTDHKLLILAVSFMVTEALKGNLFRKNSPMLAMSFGFFSGTALFWIYGISINKEAFFADHFRYHFVNRIFHLQDFGYSGYSSIGNLWWEFIRVLNPFLFLSFLITFFVFMLNRFKAKTSIFLITYSVIGAFIFSIIDWRSTKHLILLIPALLLFIFDNFPSMANNRKIIVSILSLAVIFNIWRIVHFTFTMDLSLINRIW